jgi:hypothetical protein
MPTGAHLAMASTPPPADDVLLELGRLVWAALNLEDVVYAVCRTITPRGPFDDAPISGRIADALKTLRARPADTLRDQADTWLEAATTALEARNAVLHSTPGTFYPVPPAEPMPDAADQWLVHFPRDRTRPPVHTPLTAEGLGRTRHQLEQARDGWVELAVQLFECGQ